MELHPRCAECGAVLTGVQTCQDYFYRMLYWETEDTRVLDVHHLMVLCYHLQHPSLYTSDGLVMARQLLTEFVTFEGQRRLPIYYDHRAWMIGGGTNEGYEQPVIWRMTTADVIAGGLDAYIDNVRMWARLLYEDLNIE